MSVYVVALRCFASIIITSALYELLAPKYKEFLFYSSHLRRSACSSPAGMAEHSSHSPSNLISFVQYWQESFWGEWEAEIFHLGFQMKPRIFINFPFSENFKEVCWCWSKTVQQPKKVCNPLPACLSPLQMFGTSIWHLQLSLQYENYSKSLFSI